MICSSSSAGGGCCELAAPSINAAKFAKCLAHVGPQLRDAVGDTGGLQQRLAPLRGGLAQMARLVSPEPAPGDTNRSKEGLVIRRIRHQAQIGQQILDLAPLVEADGADQPVRHAGPAERLLQRARLRVGAVEHRHLAVAASHLPALRFWSSRTTHSASSRSSAAATRVTDSPPRRRVVSVLPIRPLFSAMTPLAASSTTWVER